MTKFNYKILSPKKKKKFSYKISCSLKLQTLLNIFLLEVNFNKFIIELHLLISFMLVKFLEN